MIERGSTGEWQPLRDGRTGKPWTLIRSKPDGTAESLRDLRGRLRRFKTAGNAMRWLRECAAWMRA